MSYMWIAGPRELAETGNGLDELTQREREILALVADGCSNRAICEHLFLSERTVESHIHSIFMKLNLRPSGGEHRRVLAAVRYVSARAEVRLGLTQEWQAA